MDAGFFAKVGGSTEGDSVNLDTIRQLKSLLQAHPELLAELLVETDAAPKGTGSTT